VPAPPPPVYTPAAQAVPFHQQALCVATAPGQFRAAGKRAIARWTVPRDASFDVRAYSQHYPAVCVGFRFFGQSEQEEFGESLADFMRR